MDLLDDRVPLYMFQWMDSGPVYHYAYGGRLLVLGTFAVAVVAAAVARAPFWALWFALLGVSAFSGVPLELAGFVMLLSYLVCTLSLVRDKKRALWPAVGLVVLAGSFLLGFPRTFVAAGTRCTSNQQNLATAVQMYMSDYGAAPSSLQPLVSGNYLKHLPECGPGHSAYQLVSQGERFTVLCESGLHPRTDPAKPYVHVPEPRPASGSR